MLHARAGAWYEKTSQYPQAVDQYLQAADVERAFGILHEHLAHAWFTDSSLALDALLDRLSDADIDQHRGRMLDYALALGTVGRVEEQGRWLVRVSAGERGDPDFELRLAATRAQWHGLRGEPEAALAFEREYIRREQAGTDFVLAQFPVISARAHLYQGGTTEAIASCDRALVDADPVSEAVLLGVKGRALFEMGRLAMAGASARQAMDLASRSGIEEHVGMFDAILTQGGLALEADSLDEAERLIELALRRSERIRPPFELIGLVERAALFRARGELGDAMAALDRARAVLAAGTASPLCRRIDSLEARARLDLGDVEGTLSLAENLPPSASRSLLEASAWVVAGNPGLAEASIRRLEPAELDVRLVIEHSVIRAGLRRQAGHDNQREMTRLLELARTNGFTRSVLDGPSDLTEDLVACVLRAPRDAYTDDLLGAVERQALRKAAGRPMTGIGLSDRELGVLHYLPTCLTTREIAGELYISMNTLKSHLKSIYRKLDSSSRAEAVNRARVLGLQ